MDRRSFLKKTGATAAAAVTLPFGVSKLVEGMVPKPVSTTGDPLDTSPHAIPPLTNRAAVGWKTQIGKEQYGAVILTDKDIPAEAIADIVTRQMAETIVEVAGRRRALALARSMKA